MKRRAAPNAGQAGFTILELLVSLAFLALMAAAIPSIVAMAGRSIGLAGGLTRAHADVAALEAIGNKLAEARPLMQMNEDGSRRILFHGTADNVHFIAPGFVGTSGGLITYELGLTRDRSARPMLGLVRTLLSRGADPSDIVTDIRTPMPNTRQLSIRYFGPLDDDRTPGWTDRWDVPDALPQLVELRTVSYTGLVPQTHTIIVALRFFELLPPRRH